MRREVVLNEKHHQVQNLQNGQENAHHIQKRRMEEWTRFSDEEKDFGHIGKHFKSRTVKSILPKALDLMGNWDKLAVTDLEDRAGMELKQMVDCLEEYL